MRKLTSVLFLASLLAGPAFAADMPAAKVASSGGVSPHETISAIIGGRGGPRVTITYGRPFSKDPKTGADVPLPITVAEALKAGNKITRTARSTEGVVGTSD